jgi:tRNA(Arg) A34 adenosine deaminase TadA
MSSADLDFLQQAIALARHGREQGGEPFGALLVANGVVRHQAANRCVERLDPTAHAELTVISEHCRAIGSMGLNGYTLYTSAEPCIMCAGAIHWARISRVVFSVSQAMLQALSGGRPKPSAASLINAGRQRVEVVGPLLPDEGLRVFDGYVFAPKATLLHRQ